MALSAKARKRLETVIARKAEATEIADAIDSTLDTNVKSLIVSVTGSDSGNGSATSPFRSIQAAFDSLIGKTLLSKVTISVGPGSFSAFSLDYKRLNIPFGSTKSDNDSGVVIEGALVPATLTTGTTTGTAGSSDTAIVDLAGVLTAVTQNWTPGELVGKFIRWTSGTGSIYPIIANTATTLTYAINSPFNNLPYEIVEIATNIDSGSVTPFASGVTSDQFRVILANNPDFRLTNNNVVQFLNITSPSTTNAKAALLFGTVQMRSCRLQKSAIASMPVLQMAGQNPSLQRCVVQADGTNAIGIQFSGTVSGATVNSCFINASTTNNTFGINTLNVQNGISVNLSGATTISGFGIGLSASGAPAQLNTGTTTRFINCTTAISLGIGTNLHHSSMACIGYFSGCGTIASLTGPMFLHLAAGTTGVTNTNGVVLAQGARCKLAATTTLGASTELSVDGTTGTLVTMRGNSPKVFPLVPNPYGTYIYE